MAVSHKTNNLIHCNRCHLPFNFKNTTAPKMLSCKHWYCFNCLEHLLNTGKSTEAFLDCAQCQRSIDMQGLTKLEPAQPQQQQQFIQNYDKKKLQQLQTINQINNNNNNTNNNNISNNNNNNASNNTVNKIDNNSMISSFGCDSSEFVAHHKEIHIQLLEDQQHARRSASLASDNSLASFKYFSAHNGLNGPPDLEANLHLGSRCCPPKANVAEKMLPGENCFIHGMPNTLWCQTCLTVLCRGCNAGHDHKDHKVENQLEAKEFYQTRVKQEFLEIQLSVEEMENLKLLQRGFLLKLLETCCTLKLQIEHELANNSKTNDIDDMKDTMKNLQLCFGLLGKQTPHEIMKLYKIVKDENCKFKLKRRQMLQQCKIQQLLSKGEKILNFEMLKELLQKVDAAHNATSDLNEMSESLFNEIETGNCGAASNSIMILTNYCIYRLYMSFVKQQQQFIEQQFMRYQQYHQEQKQNLIKQFKMLQQHTMPATGLDAAASHNNNEFTTTTSSSSTTSISTSASASTTTTGNFYEQHKDKQKTYAEIATIQNAHQFDCNGNSNSNGFELLPPSNNNNNFQPYKKPLTKSYEEPRKTVQLLFNPINNETNQIYFFDFERNGLHLGRVLIKVFADIAPKMSYNFHALATHEKGVGYTGCKVFECHPNESIITGDIEQNTGYSSRSIYEDVQFIPDDTNIAPFAGAVGMRRAKKKFDSQGLVGSQFRIILTELGFTAIFGCVIEGLDVVKKISQTLVQNDKLHGASSASNGSLNNGLSGMGEATNGGLAVSGIFIAQCGLYDFVKRDLMCGI